MVEFGFFFDSVVRNGIYDRDYNSADFATYFTQLVGNGIFYKNANVMRVLAESGMRVTVSAGYGHINGRIYYLTEAKKLTLDYADGILNRVDRIVFGLNLITRTLSCYAKTGTPAVNPIGPELIRTADVWELCLAEVTVSAGAAMITQSSISDTRLDNSLCGIVTGLIKQLDATDLDIQFRTALQEMTVAFNQAATDTYNTYVNNTQQKYNAYSAATKTKYDTYSADTEQKYAQFSAEIQSMLDELNNMLDGNVAVNLQNQINTIDDQIDTLEEDMSSFIANNTRVVVSNSAMTGAGPVLWFQVLGTSVQTFQLFGTPNPSEYQVEHDSVIEDIENLTSNPDTKKPEDIVVKEDVHFGDSL